MTAEPDSWASVLIPVATFSVPAAFLWFTNRGTSANERRRNEAAADVARDKAAAEQEGRVRDWQNDTTRLAVADALRERTAGLHWREIALAWNARAWSKLGMARDLRHRLVNLQASFSVLWLRTKTADPVFAENCRPDWLRPDGTFDAVPDIPDPPGIESILDQ